MAGESLIIGNGNWGVKSGNLLGYNLNGGNYVPRELTFTRATTGTRTNGALLVEEVPYNLLQYSEQFDIINWGKTGVFITSNAITSPNNTLTADLYTSTVAGSFIVQTIDFLAQAYTFSIYVKKYITAAVSFSIQYHLSGSNNTDFSFNFDTGIPIGCTAQDAGNGWWRLTATTTLTTARNQVRLFSDNAFYIWGAQVVAGSSPLTYLPTTTRSNIPRIDYSTGTAALLMEPQRTNACPASNNIATYNYTSGVTVAANAGVSPDGLNNAISVIPTTDNNVHYCNGSSSLSAPFATNTVITMSLFIKANGYNYATVGGYFGSGPTLSESSVFNLQTGTVVSNGVNVISSSITPVSNGWYRCVTTYTFKNTITNGFLYGGTSVFNSPTGQTFAGNGTSGILIYGMQIEAATYATSYIPTTSASVTRSIDTLIQSGISNFIGQAEGTIYIDVTMNSTLNTDLILIGNSTGVLYDIYIYTGSNKITAAVINSSAYLWTSTMPADFVVGVSYRCAIAYKSGSLAFYINGVQIGTSSATFTPSTIMNRFQLNEQLYAGKQSVIVRSAKLFTSRLSNDELVTLTTK